MDKHLSCLTEQEKNTVAKFNEFGAAVTLAYGNKATWQDLVHEHNVYSDEVLKAKTIALNKKLQGEGYDPLSEDSNSIEFSKYGQSFTSQEVFDFVMAARKVRKWKAEMLSKATTLAELQAQKERLEEMTTKPKDKLKAVNAAISELLG